MFEKRILKLTKEENVKLLEQIRIIRRKIYGNLEEISKLEFEIQQQKANDLGFAKCGD